MAVNPNTPVLPTRATNNERGYIPIDVQRADPNDPTQTGQEAKALAVFVAGVLNADGTISPAGGGSGGGAAVQQVVGNVGSAMTDSGNPVKVGGIYNTGRPTLVSGQRSDLQLGQQGSLNVTLLAQDSASAITAENGFVDGVSNARLGIVVASYNKMYNGTTWDRARKPNVKSRITSTAAGGSPTNVKTTAGDLVKFWGQNGAAITYLQIYDKASAPVVGTDTPIATFPIPANAAFSDNIPGGLYLANGISYAFTTDAAGTTGAAAAAVTAFAVFAA